MVARALLIVGVLLIPPLLLRRLRRPLNGTFLGMPYDFRAPTPARIKRTVWNPESDRLLAPHLYGWGYSVNLHALGRKLGLIQR